MSVVSSNNGYTVEITEVKLYKQYDYITRYYAQISFRLTTTDKVASKIWFAFQDSYDIGISLGDAEGYATINAPAGISNQAFSLTGITSDSVENKINTIKLKWRIKDDTNLIVASGGQLDISGILVNNFPIAVNLVSKTNVSALGASDGAINISVSGGSAPYTYKWADGPTTQDRSNLVAGTYTVTVKGKPDYNHPNGDSVQYQVTIEEPAAPQNTGFKAWTTLEEYNVATGQTTGRTKPNDPADPDYAPPVYDPDTCPLP